MTRIWVPKFKIVEPNKEIIGKSSVAGRFKLSKRGPLGRRESPWFDNLILNAGLNRNGTTQTTHGLCAVGTGSSAPTVGDTALESFLASTGDSVDVFDTATESPWFARKTWTYSFGQGVAEGNLTEVGVGWADANMYSRALIEDEFGDPTTFTVESDEFLDVTYQLTCFVPLVDFQDSIDISGSSHDIVMRASDVDTAWRLNGIGGLSNAGSFQGGGRTAAGGLHSVYDGAVGAIDAAPSGSESSSSSTVNAAYVADSFHRDYTVTWDPGVGNFVTGITAVRTRMSSDGSNGADMPFQLSLNPAVEKDNSDLFTLTFRHAWARA